MDVFALTLGRIAMEFGGIALCFLIFGILSLIIAEVYIAACDRFRRICKAESMIFEFRKYRTQFLAWLQIKDGDAG